MDTVLNTSSTVFFEKFSAVTFVIPAYSCVFCEPNVLQFEPFRDVSRQAFHTVVIHIYRKSFLSCALLNFASPPTPEICCSYIVIKTPNLDKTLFVKDTNAMSFLTVLIIFAVCGLMLLLGPNNDRSKLAPV